MAIKLFISYAHRDESFKDELKEHLSGLIRSGHISEWNDRKIAPGADFNQEINQHLESSNLIIFLISSAFMDSDYCTGIEAKKALEMNQKGKAVLVPVVVRSVDWSHSGLWHLQGLPKDVKPVDTWSNRDQAWLSVTDGIKEIINPISSRKSANLIPSAATESISLTKTFLDWLDDTEISLSHRRSDKVSLQDIYTLQDAELQVVDNDKDGQKTIECTNVLLDRFNRLVILGDEQQGKTSLLKFYFRKLNSESYMPLYLDGVNLASASLGEVIKEALKKQYNELAYDKFIQSDRKVLLIDSIDRSKLNGKYKSKIVDDICANFSRCIFALGPMALWVNEVRGLHSFQRAKLLDMGHKRREEIIQKWVSLGVQHTISEEELYVKCDEMQDSINAVIRKNLIPPKPVFILILLQLLEAKTKLNLDLSSHGYCYQQLIFQSFSKAGIRGADIDTHLNVLTELSWWIFKNEQNPQVSQVEDFFDGYCKDYLDVDREKVIRALMDASIIKESGFRIGFKYSYIYYFFVGKKISESYSEDKDVQIRFSSLIANMHREDFANILIFITHHTKSSWVIDGIIETLGGLFSEHEVATLSTDQLAFMEDFIKSIPALVVDQRDIQEERNRHHEALDKREMDEEDAGTGESVELLSRINKTFKGMEIAGQIVRNRHASLKRDRLENLARDGIDAGLRLLTNIIEVSNASREEVTKVISSYLTERPDMKDDELNKRAERVYLSVVYAIIGGVVATIGSSIGSKDAIEIYGVIEKKNQTPAMLLLRQAIEMKHRKRIDVNGVSECVEKLKDNTICISILRHLVVQHLYLFHVEYKDKQKLCQLLGLSIKKQQLIGQTQRQLG
jgi:predicted transcriptional regulator